MEVLPGSRALGGALCRHEGGGSCRRRSAGTGWRRQGGCWSCAQLRREPAIAKPRFLLDLDPATRWQAQRALVRRSVAPKLKAYLGRSA